MPSQIASSSLLRYLIAVKWLGERYVLRWRGVSICGAVCSGVVGIHGFQYVGNKANEFANFAEDSRLLHEEMHGRRNAESWRRSHFTEKCRCPGCSGKETDLFAIFETTTGFRFSLHIEVKHPGDRFKDDGIQSAGYALRAACWAKNAPTNVLPHHQSSTVLLFSERNRSKYDSHLRHFKTLITFEEIAPLFPDATKNAPATA